MTAQLISESTKETVQKGFLQLGVTQVYQVILPDRDSGADDALSAAEFPILVPLARLARQPCI